MLAENLRWVCECRPTAEDRTLFRSLQEFRDSREAHDTTVQAPRWARGIFRNRSPAVGRYAENHRF